MKLGVWYSNYFVRSSAKKRRNESVGYTLHTLESNKMKTYASVVERQKIEKSMSEKQQNP